MARSLLSALLLTLLSFLQTAKALKFDLLAQPGHSARNERCIRNFVNKDTLVVVTATVGGNKGDGMVVNMHVRFINAVEGRCPAHVLQGIELRYWQGRQHVDSALHRQI